MGAKRVPRGRWLMAVALVVASVGVGMVAISTPEAPSGVLFGVGLGLAVLAVRARRRRA